MPPTSIPNLQTMADKWKSLRALKSGFKAGLDSGFLPSENKTKVIYYP